MAARILRAGAFAAGTLLLLGPAGLRAQSWDPGGRFVDWVSAESDGRLKVGLEQRGRYESRTGTSFGKDPDVDAGLVRTRLSLTYQPLKGLLFSGMLQDARAPWYGAGAGAAVRDAADLQEGYVSLFADRKTGVGLSAGRMMLNYGEGRLIGTPQWSNVSRTYDHGRLWYAAGRVRFEVLLVSPVKVRSDSFNRPVLGDRVWGTYESVSKLPGNSAMEVYLLRHDQNRQGGFSGTGRLGINTLGFRWTGPLAGFLKYSVEGAAQNGKAGAADHRAFAWFSSLSRRWTVAGKPLDISAEYKFASGARNPNDASRSRTFDQLYAANHDKFGHEDLFGWRNLHNLRSLTTFGLTRNFSLNFTYDNSWLASRYDSLYNGSGKAIARSADGSAGTHVGQETDIFGAWRHGHFQFGAGYGYLFTGRFLRLTTPGVNPRYVYIFHTYTL